MLRFCTLFNSYYLSRGVAMYNSLAAHCDNFHMYILALDNDCMQVLRQLKLDCVTIIGLREFENEKLLAVKPERTEREYCWTCASSTIKYCIEQYGLNHCTYVDADLLFFSNPKVMFEEMADKSVQITPHRYTTCFDQTETSGVYCVQYMTFKNTPEGMEVLNWWVNACLEWCFSRVEDGKFGDQKYLDDWPKRFSCVQELKNLGGGVAPWNVQQYAFKKTGGIVKGTQFFSNQQFELVFYHYHAFAYTWNNSFKLTAEVYPLNKNQIKFIYRPYVKALLKAEDMIRTVKKDVMAYQRSDEGIWIRGVMGRYMVFFLRGFYKKIYSKRYFQYDFLF